MQSQVTGTVVKKDRYEWDFNGRQGVAYSVFVRPANGDESLPADKIKVTEEQFAAFEIGSKVENMPVLTSAQLGEQGGAPVAKLVVKVPAEYVVKTLVGAGRPGPV